MSKKKYRPVVIKANNEYIPKEPYPLCEGDDGCRNVVSRWIEPRICSQCRKERSSDRS